MNTNSIKIPDEFVVIADKFGECESASDQHILPLIKEMEFSKWDQIYTLLLDVIIEGNDISKRSQVYCDIGKIHMREARKIANMIDDHLEDLGLILKYLKKQQGAEEIRECIANQNDVSLKLVNSLRKLIHNYISGVMKG